MRSVVLMIVFIAVALYAPATSAQVGAPPNPAALNAPALDSLSSASTRNAVGGLGLTTGGLPSLSLSTSDDEEYSVPIQLLLLLTVLTLAPAIVVLTTSFTRLVVVFGIMRQALGMQQSPPAQVMVGLALFLTMFVMYPVFDQINQDALQPYMDGQISQKVATENAVRPLRYFMLEQTRDKDLTLFMDLSRIDAFNSADDVPLHVLIPAFVISELRIAFQIGFMIFLPFLVVDLIVASVLMSMGMMMLPPVMISLPVKLLLFVLSDGWYLIVESLMSAYTL